MKRLRALGRKKLIALTVILIVVSAACCGLVSILGGGAEEPIGEDLSMPVAATRVQTTLVTPPAGSATFDEDVFSFEYPSDWTLITAADIPALLRGALQGLTSDQYRYIGGVYTGTLNGPDGCAQIVLVVLKDANIAGTFTDEQYEAVREATEQRMGSRLLSHRYVVVGGLPGAESIHIGVSQQTKLWDLIVVPPEPGVAYSVSCSALKGEYARFEEVFSHAIETMGFMEGKALIAVPVSAGTVPARVVRVIDGDTIVVEIEGKTYSLRYIGIDAPESAGEWLANEATAANRDLVGGKTVYLEMDTSEVDVYDRLLRYVYLADGTFVNAELVRLGYARAVAYEPDTARQDELRAAEEEARAQGRGLWAATPVPAETPVPPTAAPTQASQTSGCTPDAAFQADVTIPDNTRIEIGEPFVKTWRIGNVGTCEWGAGYHLDFAGGDQMGGPASVGVAETLPDGSTEVTLELVAPDTPGTYRGEWRMGSDDGGLFGGVLYVQIVAFDPSAPAPEPTEPAAAVGAIIRIIAVNKQAEYVDIRNQGDQPQPLTGWVLVSVTGDQKCPLSGILNPGETLRIWAMAEDANQGGYNCGYGTNIWNNNESDPAVLLNAAGEEVSRY